MFYKTHVFFCCNQKAEGRKCCQDANAHEMRDYAKDRLKKLKLQDVRINISGYLGRCAEGPVIVIYPEGVWYTYCNKADIDAIIDEHVLKGKIVESLLLPGNMEL